MKHYADRDPVALDKAGGYYLRHVSAMTREGLHSKADIAAELACRDMEIDRLSAALRGAGATKLNPDSVILQQIDGQWQKFAMLILWKLIGRVAVKISVAEIEAFHKAFAPGMPTMYVHGHSDSVDFQIVDEAAGRHLAAHDGETQSKTVN